MKNKEGDEEQRGMKREEEEEEEEGGRIKGGRINREESE